MNLVKPYGSEQLYSVYIQDIDRRNALALSALQLPQMHISSTTASNIVMLASAYFNPLTGFMNKADCLSVAQTMRTVEGLLWPVPIANITSQKPTIKLGEKVALIDPNRVGESIIAVQTVTAIEQLTDSEQHTIIANIFGTTDVNHPGVASFLKQGKFLVSGPIMALNFSYFSSDFPQIFQTAVSIRSKFRALNWNKVVAFQTRNPMHRAHEELCKMAMKDTGADGVLIHMLLGKLKLGDIPAGVRIDAINTMVKHYFKSGTALVSGYGFDMLYAGPREAVLHAIFRQNCGCSHLIVGRDHAGVGNYYGNFAAQTIFDDISSDDLQIQIYRADHTAYSKKLNRVVMMRDVSDHTMEDFILLSGTKVRELLVGGIAPPAEYSRPEVAQILMNYYQNI